MKKTIKSIAVWFLSLFKRESRSTRIKRSLEKAIDEAKWVSGYEVIVNGNSMAILENPNQIAKNFPELKKTTLYNAFKGDSRFPRTYTKGEYTVIEIK